MPTWRDLWHQRQRWQRGALENIGMYGVSSATARYWAPTVRARLRRHRAVLVPRRHRSWRGSRSGCSPSSCSGCSSACSSPWNAPPPCGPAGGERRLIAAALLLIELGYAIFLQAVYVKSLIDIATGRSKHWNAAVVEGPRRDRCCIATLVEERWFQLLTVVVGFNTIVYASFAVWKLWPRRRR